MKDSQGCVQMEPWADGSALVFISPLPAGMPRGERLPVDPQSYLDSRLLTQLMGLFTLGGLAILAGGWHLYTTDRMPAAIICAVAGGLLLLVALFLLLGYCITFLRGRAPYVLLDAAAAREFRAALTAAQQGIGPAPSSERERAVAARLWRLAQVLSSTVALPSAKVSDDLGNVGSDGTFTMYWPDFSVES